LSPFTNGDRIVIAEKLSSPLARVEDFRGQKILIFHDNQPSPKRGMLCTKCYQTDHMRAQCKTEDPWCRLCKVSGHLAGGDDCDSSTKEEQDDVRTIFGHKDPLSNHYLADVRVLGQNFASSEHAYQHTKAINAKRPDIAQKILEAKYAHSVKRVSHDIPFNPAWESRKEGIMDKILQAKFDQTPAFRQALQESEGKHLVGTAPGDFYWGSGLNAKHTAKTKKEKWPGKNTLGRTLESLRTKLQDECDLSEDKGSPPGPVTRSKVQADLAAGNQ